jgi:signal transduction histidine kinase
MEERAQAIGGTLMIDSAAALGTQICASFPLSAGEFQVEPERYESHSYSHS